MVNQVVDFMWLSQYLCGDKVGKSGEKPKEKW